MAQREGDRREKSSKKKKKQHLKKIRSEIDGVLKIECICTQHSHILRASCYIIAVWGWHWFSPKYTIHKHIYRSLDTALSRMFSVRNTSMHAMWNWKWDVKSAFVNVKYMKTKSETQLEMDKNLDTLRQLEMGRMGGGNRIVLFIRCLSKLTNIPKIGSLTHTVTASQRILQRWGVGNIGCHFVLIDANQVDHVAEQSCQWYFTLPLSLYATILSILCLFTYFGFLSIFMCNKLTETCGYPKKQDDLAKPLGFINWTI